MDEIVLTSSIVQFLKLGNSFNEKMLNVVYRRLSKMTHPDIARTDSCIDFIVLKKAIDNIRNQLAEEKIRSDTDKAVLFNTDLLNWVKKNQNDSRILPGLDVILAKHKYFDTSREIKIAYSACEKQNTRYLPRHRTMLVCLEVCLIKLTNFHRGTKNKNEISFFNDLYNAYFEEINKVMDRSYCMDVFLSKFVEIVYDQINLALFETVKAGD
jgi:hypothetical protein